MKKFFITILLLCAISQIQADIDNVIGDNTDIKYISRIEMVQNLSPKGCIVKIYYLYKRPDNVYDTKEETVYSNESYEVADNQVIWRRKATGKYTHAFYLIGLYKYTNTVGARSTLRKFTIKKAVYLAYKKNQK